MSHYTIIDGYNYLRRSIDFYQLNHIKSVPFCFDNYIFLITSNIKGISL